MEQHLDAIPKYIKERGAELQNAAALWAEREELRRRASVDSAAIRRVRFWDFFFAKRFESELFRPLDREINDLEGEKAKLVLERNVHKASRDRIWNRRLVLALVLGYICLLASPFVPQSINWNSTSPAIQTVLQNVDARMGWDVLCILCGGGLGLFSLAIALLLNMPSALALSRDTSLGKSASLSQDIDSLNEELDKKRQLRQSLQSQLPPKVLADEIIKWAEEELQQERDQAESSLAIGGHRIEDLNDYPPLRMPARLQDSNDLFDLLAIRPMLANHLAAYEIVKSSSGVESFIYCMYRTDMIVPAKDMLVTHNAYYDLIEGRHVSLTAFECYYKHIVAITINYEGQKLDDWTIEEAPCLSIELANGATRKFVFSHSHRLEYQAFGRVIRDMFAESSLDERVVSAIRQHIRDHKLIGESR